MQIIIENEYAGEDFQDILNFDYQKTAEDVISGVLSDAGCPYSAEVNILLVGLPEIQEINREARQIDAPTDVLSFPLHEYDAPADFSELVPGSFDDFDPETGDLLLGDIVLSVPKIKSQAEEYGHSTLREYAFLVAHSTLHLIGYDHISEEEAKAMFAKQEEILKKLAITRD